VTPEHADASTDTLSAYHTAAHRAIAEFDAGHYLEARALFLRAHALRPSARTLRTLGMTSFELRTYPRALQELRAALDDKRRPLEQSQREQVAELIARTLTFVGRYRLELSPVDAEVVVDGVVQGPGARALTLSLGSHQMQVRATGYQEQARALLVQGREDTTLRFQLSPVAASTRQTELAGLSLPATIQPSERAPNRVASVTAFGVGALGLISAGVFTALTLQRKSEIAPQCQDGMCPASLEDEVNEMQSFADVATVSLGFGVVGAALGTFLWLREPSSRGATVRSNAWLRFQPTSVALRGQF